MPDALAQQTIAEAAWRARIRALIQRTLSEAGFEIQWNTLDAAVREARTLGARLLAAEYTGSSDASRRRVWQAGGAPLGLGYDALERVTGFGAWQAHALRLEGAPSPAVADAAREGALAAAAWFNLGIVLFDALLDHDPEGEAILRQAFGATSEASTGSHGMRMPKPSSFGALASHKHQGVAFFGCVAACFFSAIGKLDASTQGAVQRLLPELFAAEMGLAQYGRSVPPSRTVWRAMRAKSAGPMRLVGQLAASGLNDASSRQRVDSLARHFGECLWIVDDLCDASDDWRSGAWSRVWWQLAGPAQKLDWADPAHAAWALERSGLIDREAQRLAASLLRMRDLACPSTAKPATHVGGGSEVAIGHAAWAAAVTTAAWVG